MKDAQPFTYVLLRYRHDPLAGELVNVGVVVHSATDSFLGVKLRRTIRRLTKLFPDINKSDFTSTLNAIERGISRLGMSGSISLHTSGGDAGALARRVLPDDDQSFVWGDVGSGMTRDPDATLDKLYARFVGLYDDVSRAGRDDAAVWQPVRERLVERRLADRLQPKVIVSPIDRVEFEHAWKNGAWHCYQPLSFDLASGDNIRDKAARWSGHMTGLSKAAEAIRPHFIVGQPANADLFDDYRKAIELLRASALEPAVYEETEIDALVDRIEHEISHEAM